MRKISQPCGWILSGILVISLIGCGRHDGVIQETKEFTFDDIAATAAAETMESESGQQ